MTLSKRGLFLILLIAVSGAWGLAAVDGGPDGNLRMGSPLKGPG